MAVEPLSPGTHKQDDGECIVSGVHALALRLSSVFGMAPLRFKPHGNGYTVSLSNYMCIYSYLLAVALVAITFVGIALERMVGITPSAHMYSYVAPSVYTCDVIMVLIMASVGVFGAPGRMRRMLKFMDTIASVDNSVSALYSHAKERRVWAALIFFLAFLTALKVQDLCFFLLETKLPTKIWAVLAHHFLWFQIMTLEVQFAFTVLSVQTRFKAVNEALSLTARHLSNTQKTKHKSTETLNLLAVKVAPSESQFEKAVVIVKKSVTGEPRLVVSPSDAVHRIASLHGSLCDVVHCIEQCYSTPLILIMTSTLLQLIVTSYFAYLEIDTQMSADQLQFIIVETLWIILLILRLLMVVEPCHYTAVEGKKTESLVCRLLLVTPTSGPLSARLELFSRQLMMQLPSYNPMGLFTVGRPLIASIFGAVATYLVILIQFQETGTSL